MLSVRQHRGTRTCHRINVFLSFLFLMMCLEICQPSPLKTVVVSTDVGSLRGLTWTVSDGTELSVFLGVPYAQPPLGALRFSPTVSRAPWSPSEWNATYFRPACPQPLAYIQGFSFGYGFNNTSEDCLYLNIFTPRSAMGRDSLPVMVWFHGGAYKYGSGSEYLGHELSSRRVVVVTLTYRLGVLGFLSTESDVARGNYGLLDQIEALKWTKRNIAKFGGDPNKVVVLGQSAGGGCVTLLQFSPLAQGLFCGVVAESGTALSPWAVYRPPYRPRDKAAELARQLGCPLTPDRALIDCLRNQSADALVVRRVPGPPMIATWAPIVDGRVLPDLPEKMMEKGQIARLPVMVGTLPQDASEELEDIPGVESGINASLYRQLVWEWSQRFESHADRVRDAVLRVYPASPNQVANRENFLQLKTDYAYISPGNQFARELSQLGGKVWMYSFRYLPQINHVVSWKGVAHAEELYYLFGTPLWNGSCPGGCPPQWTRHQDWTSEEVAVSKTVMTIWTNFVRNLDPNPVPGLGQLWDSYGDSSSSLLASLAEERICLVINRNTTLSSNQNAQLRHFWTTEFSALIKDPVPVG